MSINLDRRLAAVEARAAPVGADVPTLSQLWRWELVAAVDSARKFTEAGGRDDRFRLHAHAQHMRSRGDILKATDDVLLEALGLPNVQRWGWLYFMVRNLSFYSLLAHNWDLPYLKGEYGFGPLPWGDETERRAMAGRYFCALMRECYGVDPLANLCKVAVKLKDRFQRRYGRELTEQQFAAWLHKYNEWAYFVYTCEVVKIRPEALAAGNDEGRVLYQAADRVRYLAEMRAGPVRQPLT